MLVNRIIDGKRQKELAKDVKISNLKQDVLREKAKRFKIENEEDFDKAHGAMAEWRENNPLGHPHR